MIILVHPLAFTCRLCWSPLYTWLSQCTAAAASLLPLPPVHCRLRRRAGPCKSPATVSGARRWWAGPPPPAQSGSLTPTPAPRAEDTPAGVQLRGDCSGEKRKGEAEKAQAAFRVHLQSHPMIPQFRHHSGFREPGSTIFFTCYCNYRLQPPLPSQFCHCITAHWVSVKTKLPIGRGLNKRIMVWQGRI